MSSSTSSSERALPLALIAALAVVVCVELGVGATATSFMESQPLIYETKLAALDAGTLRGEVVVLGDSTAVAALRPSALQAALPDGWRLANLALPGSGPVVGEFLLRRILAAAPGEPPPRLLVLHFSTLSFTEWRPNFVEYPLTHLLPLGPVLRAAWAERDLGYLLEWIATRLPTVRHREELKSGALSLLFDRWPALADRYRALTADTSHDALFRWRTTRRAERNRHLAQQLLRERGWHRFDEMRLPEGELDANVRYDRGAFLFPPFAATPREEQALARLLGLCAAHSIPVLVLPAAQPRALAEALDRDGGAERLDAFSRRVFAGRPGVAAPEGLRLPWPHRFFGDLAHLNEAGAERYTLEIERPLHDAAAAARGRDGAALPRASCILCVR
jgi:hypothetical protein